MELEGADTELVVVNPTFILGPTLTTDARSSLQMIKAMLDGTITVLPRQRFGVADVRDVADLHIRAMATPEAAGKRFLALADGPTISYLQLARDPARPARTARREGDDRRSTGGRAAESGHSQRPGSQRAWLATASRRRHNCRYRREPARSRPAAGTMTANGGTESVLITGSTRRTGGPFDVGATRRPPGHHRVGIPQDREGSPAERHRRHAHDDSRRAGRARPRAEVRVLIDHGW